MRKKILIVVDMQNDFIAGSLANEEAQKIIDNVVDKVEEAINSNEYERVFFTMDTHHDNYLFTEEGMNLPIEHCMDGTWGQEIISSLQPYLDNSKCTIYEKEAFGSIDLAICLSEIDNMKRAYSEYLEIELIGVCTDICVVSNALLIKAFLPNTHISVDASCCAGTTPENHQNALKTMQCCHIHVR